MLNLEQFQPRPAQVRSQYNRPQAATVPEIPRNYDPDIQQARTYAQMPIEQESIPNLLKRLAAARMNQAKGAATDFPSFPLPIKIGFAVILFALTCAAYRPILVHLVPLQPVQTNATAAR